MKKKCKNCLVGTFDISNAYSGGIFIFENIFKDKKELKRIKSWVMFTLFDFCPFCGHKNSFKLIKKLYRYFERN